MRLLALCCALLGCHRAAPAPPSSTSSPVIYEIFARAFSEAGDLRGITSRLDHVRDLGAGAIWLTPVHPSPSAHGYDVTDFLAIHPRLGTDADFDGLVAASHARGLRVILDLVVNHTSDRHPWFRDHRDRYVFQRQPPPDWRRPWDGAPVWHAAADGTSYFALFWSGMPDLDHRKPAVRDEMVRIMRHWLARGVDGFRVDAARHLVESADGQVADTDDNVAYLGWLRAQAERLRPGATFLAETWTDHEHLARYRDTGALLTDFEVGAAVIAALSGGTPAPLARCLGERRRLRLPWSTTATFLSNHDLPRLRERLVTDDAILAAHAILLTLPGTPIVYYGEEVGMTSGPGEGDVRWRTPMAWAEVDAHRGLLESVRALVALRKHPALADDVDVEVVEAPAGVLVLRRAARGAELWTLVNLSSETRDAPVVLPLPAGRTAVRAAWGDGGVVVDAGRVRWAPQPGHAAVVVEVR